MIGTTKCCHLQSPPLYLYLLSYSGRSSLTPLLLSNLAELHLKCGCYILFVARHISWDFLKFYRWLKVQTSCLTTMLHRIKLSILLLGLTLVLLGPACKASSLGLTVQVVPLDSNGGKTVRAHFTAIAPNPCPTLSGLCAEGEDCVVYPTSLPFTGEKPDPGWCVRQWQKTVPSNYSGFLTLGSNTIYISMNAGPVFRTNTGRLNQPPYVALPPPLRARVNCPHDFSLSVKDLDGDRVRCRFALPEQGECQNCTQYPFIELDKEKCLLTFTGGAPTGQYFIYLMAEDLIPVPKIKQVTDSTPLSSIPLQLSLTVEESNAMCIAEPVVNGDTPKDGTTTFVLPYEEVKFDAIYMSQLESVSEIAVVGPPELYRVNFKSVGSMAMLSMAWVRSENNLTRLLPICFAANTISLQSEPTCVWLYQKEMKRLPAGSELTCEMTEMILVLPVASLNNINLAELQLNSATCPVTYNSTYLTAYISFTGCGTKIVSSGSELVYTNTLKSVRPYSPISRNPSLILPLACRIPKAQVRGPQFNVSMPTETEVFGVFEFHLEFHFPGEGPLANLTRNAKLRSLQPLLKRRRREAESLSGNHSISIRSTNDVREIGSRIDKLDLYVLTNCSINRAELIVSKCIQSETEDFTISYPLIQQGCSTSNNTLEVITPATNVKIYRLDLSTLAPTGTTMYVQCTVNLCISTNPSKKCPDLCNGIVTSSNIVTSVFTKSYTINSGAVSLLVTTTAQPTTTISTISTNTTSSSSAGSTVAPNTASANPSTTGTGTGTIAATTATIATTAITVTTATQSTTTSHASKPTLSMTAGLILATVIIFLQNNFLY
ncbi:uncharacterized protein [Channa argus]|uniref:uncharacterized protein n=1 Tax=Channa argus TaxID=215402 RepID=UPI00352014FB